VDIWTDNLSRGIFHAGCDPMTTIWVGHLIGTFHGYSPGRTYELSDGTKWHQQDLTDEPVYGEDPNAKLLSDPDTVSVYIDVRGTSATVRVFQAGGRPKQRARTL
jgi:hypothetical protein